MNTQRIPLQGRRVCSPRQVRRFDNFLRSLLHNPRKLFGPYVRPGMNVLDIGCGAGFASLGLARLLGDTGTVIAADLQPEMLEMVAERAACAGLSHRVRLHRCEAGRIGLEEPVDFVLAFWMVHELDDSRAFLKEVLSLLNPGGRFLMIEPKIHVPRSGFERVVSEAGQIGFTIVGRPPVRISRAVVLRKDSAAVTLLK